MPTDREIIDNMVKAGMLVTDGAGKYDVDPSFAVTLRGLSRQRFVQRCILIYLRSGTKVGTSEELLQVSKIVATFVPIPEAVLS